LDVETMDRSGLYFALVILALVVALWLALQVLGIVFKLVFFSAIVLVAVAAFRAWRGSASHGR
jgi:hypothetical protein